MAGPYLLGFFPISSLSRWPAMPGCSRRLCPGAPRSSRSIVLVPGWPRAGAREPRRPRPGGREPRQSCPSGACSGAREPKHPPPAVACSRGRDPRQTCPGSHVSCIPEAHDTAAAHAPSLQYSRRCFMSACSPWCPSRRRPTSRCCSASSPSSRTAAAPARS